MGGVLAEIMATGASSAPVPYVRYTTCTPSSKSGYRRYGSEYRGKCSFSCLNTAANNKFNAAVHSSHQFQGVRADSNASIGVTIRL